MLVRSCTISVTSDFGKPKITLTRPSIRLQVFWNSRSQDMGYIELQCIKYFNRWEFSRLICLKFKPLYRLQNILNQKAKLSPKSYKCKCVLKCSSKRETIPHSREFSRLGKTIGEKVPYSFCFRFSFFCIKVVFSLCLSQIVLIFNLLSYVSYHAEHYKCCVSIALNKICVYIHSTFSIESLGTYKKDNVVKFFPINQ